MYTKHYSTINASTKGAAVIRTLAESDAPLSRKELAESAGCTVARVGEVLRALGDAVQQEGTRYSLSEEHVDLLPEPTQGRSNGEVVEGEEVPA